MEIVELRPELRLLLFDFGQAYLWSDGGSLTLIDTGVAGSGAAVQAALDRLGFDRRDLTQVVLTHFHDDHAGGAAEIGGWDGVTVLAHERDAPIIRGEVPGPPPNFTDAERVLHAQIAAGLPPAPPARVDRELRDGEVLPFGGGARVVATPGHTDGSIAVYLPEHQVVFTGDTVAHVNGQVMLGPFNLDRAQAADSFRRLAALDAELACVGHGDPLRRDAGVALRAAAAELPR